MLFKRTSNLCGRVMSLNRLTLAFKLPSCSLVSFQQLNKSSINDQLLSFAKPSSCFEHVIYSSRAPFWTNTHTLNAAQKETPKAGSLSDELQNIMSKKFADEKQQTPNNELKHNLNENASEGAAEKTPTGWAKYFSREHGWKISFLFFTGLFGSLAIYILLEWGAPRRDENNQIVNLYLSLSIFSKL